MRAILKILILAMVLVMASCGDATRNDQGVSFAFLGWFTDTSGGEAKTALALPLSIAADTADENTILAVGLLNNLTGQFINVYKIEHDYYIPGAAISIPSTTFGLSSFIGPAAAAEGANTSTLPVGFDQANSTFAETFLITPEVMEFIQLSREYLPEPPFTMIVTSKITGTTSSGKEVTTNEIQFAVEFFSDIAIAGA